MAKQANPAPWQRLQKARRASVYRAIGRAARDAREAGDKTVEADVRLAMNVLRASSRVAAVRKRTADKRRRKSPKR